jgi:hypothetical protein
MYIQEFLVKPHRFVAVNLGFMSVEIRLDDVQNIVGQRIRRLRRGEGCVECSYEVFERSAQGIALAGRKGRKERIRNIHTLRTSCFQIML